MRCPLCNRRISKRRVDAYAGIADYGQTLCQDCIGELWRRGFDIPHIYERGRLSEAVKALPKFHGQSGCEIRLSAKIRGKAIE